MPDEALLELREVMRRLRAECPWKREQTHRSLVRYLLEEAHETVDAIETGTPDDLREELGDLLLQVYFHAAVAEQAGEFTVDDVAAGIVAKMRRRNPHVFGDAGAQRSAAEVNELWESVKAAERPRPDLTDGIAPTLPALLHADKVLDRLARAGRTAPAVEAPLLVLVPSPLLGPAAWQPVAWWLRGRGHEVEVADQVAGAAEEVAEGRSVVVVEHSGAGLRATRPGADTEAEGRSAAILDGDRLHDPAAVGAAVLDLLDRPAGPALGDRLLSLVGEARAAGVDPEQELRDAVRRLLARTA